MTVDGGKSFHTWSSKVPDTRWQAEEPFPPCSQRNEVLKQHARKYNIEDGISQEN